MFAAFAVVSTIALGVVDFYPKDVRAGAAVIFPPWVSGAAAIERATAAGAVIVRRGRYAFIVVVRPHSADFVAHALEQGALAVVDPGALGGCFARKSGST